MFLFNPIGNCFVASQNMYMAVMLTKTCTFLNLEYHNGDNHANQVTEKET